MFNIGDRVIYCSNEYYDKILHNQIGTVMCLESDGTYIIYFDNNTVGGWAFSRFNIPDGHGRYVEPNNLQLAQPKASINWEDDYFKFKNS